MNTLIRKAVTSDVSHLMALSRRTISASYRSFLGDEAVDAFIGSGAADRYVEENVGRCLVILRDEKVVGYAVWQDNLIDLMMIDDAAHRQGLGTLLLQQVEAALFQRCDELILESFEGNQSANAFYRKNGWREVRKRFDEESSSRKIIFGKSR
jgi:ribosomal protein S18 acetylase RimI-like enzyme